MSTKYPQGLINGIPPYTTGNFSGVWTLEQLAKNYYFFGDGVSNSLRFRSSASAYLNRTPSTASNQQTWTWSGWVKRGKLGAEQAIFVKRVGAATAFFRLIFQSNDILQVWDRNSSSVTTLQLDTSAVYRDASAWYHIVLAVDTTQASSTNRAKLYVNGVGITAFSTATYPSQNTSLGVNSAEVHTIGVESANSTYFDGYMAEINFIDGLALDPSSFGVVAPATGVWSPKRYSGNYGLNGFYLPFSNGTSTTTLGYDSSGNGNNWTTNNISLTAGSTYDWMLDSPTSFAGTSYGVGNYAVLNPLTTALTISTANTNVSVGSGGWQSVFATMAVSSAGKWYWEVLSQGSPGAGYEFVGLSDVTDAIKSSFVGSTTNSYGYLNNGNKYNNSSAAAYGASWTINDIIGVALDMDAGTITFYKNNVSQGIAFSGLSSSRIYAPALSILAASSSLNINFGQRPFSYTPPSGYKSLCTFNLPGPSINNGAGYMAATLYTGNGATQSISNAVNGVSFQPDFVWVKSRSSAGNHSETDSVRGVNKQLFTNLTDAEGSQTDQVTALNSNGFALGANAAGTGSVNVNGVTYVAWNWKAGGTAVTNTAGSITSSVSANTTSGFSVVTWTSPASGTSTVGHGLGIAPAFFFIKNRPQVDNWQTWHTGIGGTQYLTLNTTSAVATNANVFSSAPTSTVLNFGANITGGQTYVAYCFAAIPNYSAFGSYTGNGSTDGVFVYCGFRPRYVLVRSTGAANWIVIDTSRDPYNVASNRLLPNSSQAESTFAGDTTMDILSNGFKLRSADGQQNANGIVYIYAAFAENPFKYSLAR